MKNKVLLIIGIVALSVIILVGALYLFVLSGSIFMFDSKPSKPEITYGEFPISITYELNGKTKTVEDTVICEFNGYGPHTSAGQSRKWKTYLKGNSDALIQSNEQSKETGFARITLLDLRDDSFFDESGHKILELYFFGGTGHYYMNDELGGHVRNVQDFTSVDYMYQNTDGSIGYSALKADEALEKYKIKLISCEVSEPIHNSFK